MRIQQSGARTQGDTEEASRGGTRRPSGEAGAFRELRFTRFSLRASLLVAVVTFGGCAVWTGSAFEPRDRPAPVGSAEQDRLVVGDAEVDAPTEDPETEELIRTAPDHPAVEEFTSVSLEREDFAPPPRDYRVGAHDVLYVHVYGVEQLSSPVGGRELVGSRVDGEGYIQLPLLGPVYVGGMTAKEIQQDLQMRFEQVIAEPSVVVEVLRHRSQPLYLVGEFREPTVYYMDRPVNVVQALAHGSGFTEDAHIRGARVVRGERTLPVDIYRLLREGDLSHNIYLKPGDTLYVPDTVEQRVFVLGAIEEPGPVEMMHDRLTLTQAIASAGGAPRPGTSLTHVRIIRSLSPTRGEVIVVNYEKIRRGEALDFPLLAGDLVYVPRSALGDWNDMVAEITPTLRLISSLLQPFVQISVLFDSD